MVIDKDHKLVAISHNYLKLMGENPTSWQGKDFSRLLQKHFFAALMKEPDALKNTLAQVFVSGAPVILTVTGIATPQKEGQPAYELLFKPVKNENGETEFIIHQATAVTQPEASKGKAVGSAPIVPDLSREVNIYRTIAANLPNGIVYMVDQQLRYVLAEGQALQATAQAPSDIEGKSLWEVVDVKNAEKIETDYRAALYGKPFRHEQESLGRHYLSHGTPLRNEQGIVYAVLVVAYDITERKQAEEALRQSEEHLQLILESAKDYAIFTLDKAGKLTNWNAGAERLLGYTKEEAIGQPGKIIFIP